MIALETYLRQFPEHLTLLRTKQPWEIPASLLDALTKWISQLDASYTITNNIAIHKTAQMEEGVILKGPLVVGENCFIGAHAYIRGGVYLDKNVSIGPSCEIKSSVICQHAAVAHFNFIGDSLIGCHVNFEAGAVIANHYNEREDKMIYVVENTNRIRTGCYKFGSLVGDQSKIGANAVLSPGTLLLPGSIVKRLELVEQ